MSVGERSKLTISPGEAPALAWSDGALLRSTARQEDAGLKWPFTALPGQEFNPLISTSGAPHCFTHSPGARTPPPEYFHGRLDSPLAGLLCSPLHTRLRLRRSRRGR